MEENNIKVFVDVLASFNRDGTISPKAITWEDGRMYEIDEIKDVRKAASIKAGGIGMRYTIRVGNTFTFLWHDDKRWFVERK